MSGKEGSFYEDVGTKAESGELGELGMWVVIVVMFGLVGKEVYVEVLVVLNIAGEDVE